MHRWGIVPSWSTSVASAGARYINARAETVATSPVFRTSFLRRRCIIPADGFYEWRRDGKRKQPFLIHTPDRCAARVRRTVGAVEGPGDRRVAAVGGGRHDRGERDRRRAAQPDAGDPRRRSVAAVARPGAARRRSARARCCEPAPDELLELRPASPLVNNANNEGPGAARSCRRGRRRGAGRADAARLSCSADVVRLDAAGEDADEHDDRGRGVSDDTRRRARDSADVGDQPRNVPRMPMTTRIAATTIVMPRGACWLIVDPLHAASRRSAGSATRRAQPRRSSPRSSGRGSDATGRATAAVARRCPRPEPGRTRARARQSAARRLGLGPVLDLPGVVERVPGDPAARRSAAATCGRRWASRPTARRRTSSIAARIASTAPATARSCARSLDAHHPGIGVVGAVDVLDHLVACRGRRRAGPCGARPGAAAATRSKTVHAASTSAGEPLGLGGGRRAGGPGR